MTTEEYLFRIISFVLGFVFFFVFIAIKSKAPFKYRLILSLHMLVYGLRHYISFLIWVDYRPLSLYLFLPSISLIFTEIIFIYIYIKILTEDKLKRNSLIIHFLPAIILFVATIVAYSGLSYSELIAFREVGPYKLLHNDNVFMRLLSVLYIYSNDYLVILQYIVYQFLFVKIFLLHKKRIKNAFSYDKDISVNWFGYFIIFNFIYISYDLLNLFFDIQSTAMYFFLVVPFLFYVTYFGMNQKKIPKIYKQPTLDDKAALLMLPDNLVNKIDKRLMYALTEQKVYKNKKLTISSLAKKIGTNSRYLSEIINKKYNKNFFTFINEYRINKAMDMLKDNKYNNISIEGISVIVGFQSKSTFNAAFKKYVKQTPSQYKISQN